MKNELPLISFTVIENEQRLTVNVKHGGYPNLMFLLKEELGLDSFGECGGVGRCATCAVHTKGVTGVSANKERNEPNTLEQLGFEDKNIRLSCQLYITADLNGTMISVLE